jgi:hypothetical protein
MPQNLWAMCARRAIRLVFIHRDIHLIVVRALAQLPSTTDMPLGPRMVTSGVNAENGALNAYVNSAGSVLAHMLACVQNPTRGSGSAVSSV